MTNVFRLPEEPPIGTVVRPEPDDGWRYSRRVTGWFCAKVGVPGCNLYGNWATVLNCNPSVVTVLEPDPHPTPWHIYEGDNGLDRVGLIDGWGVQVGTVDSRVAQRIVDAVNEAATT